MQWNDIGNGLFEAVGAFFTWKNYIQLRKEREIKGVYWPMTLFFTAWGFWNLHYYPSLGQWVSFYAGIVLVLGNAFWVILALKLKYFTPPENGVWTVKAGTWERPKDVDPPQ